MTDPEANLAIARRITAAFEQGDDATLRVRLPIMSSISTSMTPPPRAG